MKKKFIFAVFTAVLLTVAVGAGCTGTKAQSATCVHEGEPGFETGPDENGPPALLANKGQDDGDLKNPTEKNKQKDSPVSDKDKADEEGQNPKKGNSESVKKENVNLKESSEKIQDQLSEKIPDQSSEKIQNQTIKNTTQNTTKDTTKDTTKGSNSVGDKITPGVNAPEPDPKAAASPERPKLTPKAEEAVRQVLESNLPEATSENAGGGTYYPIITTGGTPIPVYAGPGTEFERKYDNGSMACLPSSMLALNFPVTLLGRTDNGWLHISYKSTNGRYAYEIAEEHDVEGYVQEGYQISESDNQARLEQQEEAAKNNQKVLAELEKEQEKAEKEKQKDLEEAEIGQEKAGKNEQEKEEENEPEEHAKKEEQNDKTEK